jgi:simple sugar transport system permease protein
MNEAIDLFFTASLWAAVFRIATPLIFGMLGELICERAGVVNLGIEGIMTFGALSAWLAVFHGCDLWTGMLVAAASGAAFGLLHALLTVPMAQSQHVTGLGITLLATSLASFIYRLAVPAKSTPPTIMPFQPVDLPFLNAPFLAATAPTYLALGLTAVVAYVLWRTPLGLAIRMAGEHPQGAQAQGISVLILRTGCVMVGSAIMALGGAFLSLAAFNSFVINMVQGRGWMALALVVFGAWRPGLALLGALLYAWFDAYQLRLQHVFPGVPYQIFLMAPYVLSIAVLIPMSRRASGPQALMMPFVKGER